MLPGGPAKIDTRDDALGWQLHGKSHAEWISLSSLIYLLTHIHTNIHPQKEGFWVGVEPTRLESTPKSSTFCRQPHNRLAAGWSRLSYCRRAFMNPRLVLYSRPSSLASPLKLNNLSTPIHRTTHLQNDEGQICPGTLEDLQIRSNFRDRSLFGKESAIPNLRQIGGVSRLLYLP